MALTHCDYLIGEIEKLIKNKSHEPSDEYLFHMIRHGWEEMFGPNVKTFLIVNAGVVCLYLTLPYYVLSTSRGAHDQGSV